MSWTVVGLLLSAALRTAQVAAAEDGPPSSYSPVVIKEDFSAIAQRMAAAKAEIEARHKGLAKYVSWCPCDGVHSTWCEFWPFRFGMGPDKVRRRFGPQLITPEMMPDANVNLDDLPALPPRIETTSAETADPATLERLRHAREVRLRKRLEEADLLLE